MQRLADMEVKLVIQVWYLLIRVSCRDLKGLSRTSIYTLLNAVGWNQPSSASVINYVSIVGASIL